MIRIHGLHKTFNGKKVLDGVEMEIKDRMITTVIGQSGCGKSVLLKHIVGLHRGDSGTIEVDGVEVFEADAGELRELRRQFSYLFQGGALFDSLTIWENVAFPLMWGEDEKTGRSEARKKARDMLDLVGMKDTGDLKPSELSGGMQKRAALARAIIRNPKYILYDEPTTGLDPLMSSVIDQLIIKMSRELDVTSVVVTHDMSSVEEISDRVCMLHRGQIVLDTEIKKLKSAKEPVVRKFITRNGWKGGVI